ncbi:hypothetical protein OUZ56_003933 [Daphnia magna]|uniref:Uncharacterized protein n=1 Tax=Daphnia magna TaxID=35525 RepID=A0ABQ9YNM2_9CRUS|nr:hypothetical protein OUZ56_003933 [Daphnia magna]
MKVVFLLFVFAICCSAITAAPQLFEAKPSIYANIGANIADLETAEAIPGRRYYTGSRSRSSYGSRSYHRTMHRG